MKKRSALPLLALVLSCSQPPSNPATSLPTPALTSKQRIAQLFAHEKAYAIRPGYQSLPAYQRRLSQLTPDINQLENPLVAVDDAQTLRLGGDMLFPRQTLAGAVTTTLLAAQAVGEPLDPLRQEIDRASRQLRSAGSARYIYSTSATFWPWENGRYRIGYSFVSDLPQPYRTGTRQAMDEWQQASGGRIQFVETALQTGSHLLINDTERRERALASAHVGAYAFFTQRLSFNVPLIDQHLPKYSIKSIALHELGHTLGLWHEQERADRNNYLDIKPEDQSKYHIFSLFDIVYDWQLTSFSLPGGGSVLVSIPTPRTTSWRSRVSNTYDYRSIMHYGGLVVKQNTQGFERGDKTEYNSELTAFDQQAAQAMYPPRP